MYILFWNLLRKAESSSQGQLVAQSKMKWFIDAGLSASSIFNRNEKKKKQNLEINIEEHLGHV